MSFGVSMADPMPNKAMSSDNTKSLVLSGSGQLENKIRDALKEIDQVSLCQMLLLTIQRLAPKDMQDKWDLSVGAQKILDDIGALGGRENELSLISAWSREPQNEQAKSFYDFAVVEPCRRLSELGKAVIRTEFTKFLKFLRNFKFRHI